jgi:eukaryotic-like serine/threonine-protein kinase
MKCLSQSVAEDGRLSPSAGQTQVFDSVELAPTSPAERSNLIDRAYDEYIRLEKAGYPIDPEKFCARFPALRTSLKRLLAVHNGVADLVNDYPGALQKLTAAERWPQKGEIYHGYQLLEELGRGGFARVFLARERTVGNRLVAVKLTLYNDREADTLGKLAHPNVVPIFSTQHDDASGFTAVCMPFMGGATLEKVLDELGQNKQRPTRARVLLDSARDDRWPSDGAPVPALALRHGSFLDGVVYLGTRLADALAYVHKHNILHRDLKPSNVLVSPNGEPVLLDFNLALGQEYAGHRAAGTVPYMPPEQLEAMRGSAGGTAVAPAPSADIYGLGVLLYELMTGAHPFGPVPMKMKRNDLCAFLLEQQRRGPRPMRELNRQVDARLEAVILSCLSFDPARRPASARDLAATLERYHAPMNRARRWVLRHSWAAAAALVLALSGAGAGAYELATMPTAADRHAQSGEAYFHDFKFREAAEAFSQALEANPNKTDVLFKRGRAYQQMGGWTRALSDYANVLKSCPDAKKGAVLACMGFCESKLNEHEKAIQHYQQAEKAGFKTADVYNDWAYSLLSKDKCKAAEELTATAIKLDPNHLAARFNHADAVLGMLLCGNRTIDPTAALIDLGFVFSQPGAPGTDNEYRKAARLCRQALKYQNSFGNHADDDRLNTLGREYTLTTIKRGYPRDALSDEIDIAPWLPSPEQPVASGPMNSSFELLIDPLRGLLP